jgi:hypothetical protein
LADHNDGDASTTHVALFAKRNGQDVTCGELQSRNHNLFYGSFRVNARIWGDPGAVVGMFTYFNDTVESDIEVLTQNSTDIIFYTNQPNVDSKGHTVSQAGIHATMPNNTLWTDWNTHRLDWLPNISRFFVNDIETGSNTYGVPNHASSFILNVWSDGNKNWSGTFQDGAAAYMEVQWVEMLFNTTDNISQSSCKTVCAIDGVKTIGNPEQLSTSTGGKIFPSSSVSLSFVAVAFYLIQYMA